MTEYYRSGGLNYIYFLQFWRLEVYDQGASRFVSGEDPLPGLQTAVFLLYLHVAEGEILCLLPFYKGTNAILKGSALMT